MPSLPDSAGEVTNEPPVSRAYRNGERIKVRTLDDDGLPIVRYGTVGATLPADGPVVVMFDDLLGGDIVDRSEIEPVSVDTIELELTGRDLCDDARLRAGLADMWRAEADLAGLSIGAVRALGDDAHGVRDSDGWLLAEFTHEGLPHVVRCAIDAGRADTVIVRADRSNRWDGFTA